MHKQNSVEKNTFLKIHETVQNKNLKILYNTKNEIKGDNSSNIKNHSDLYEFALSFAKSYDFIKK